MFIITFFKLMCGIIDKIYSVKKQHTIFKCNEDCEDPEKTY